MRKVCYLLIVLFIVVLPLQGCIPVFIGAGLLGGYAVGKDSLRAEVGTSFDRLVKISKDVLINFEGEIQDEDLEAGRLKAAIGKSVVKISIDTLETNKQRLIISSRRAMLPHMSLANDILVEIIKKAR